MNRGACALLAAIIAAVGTVDLVWWRLAHFDVDAMRLAEALAWACLPLSITLFYSFVRKDEQLATVTAGVTFLALLAPLGTMLSYFALSIAGPDIDPFWARIDRSVGFSWPAMFRFVAERQLLFLILNKSYIVADFFPVIAVGMLGIPRDFDGIWKLCLAIALCTILTIAFWTVLPSFGAYVVYGIPRHVGKLAFSNQIPDHLKWMYVHGPGRINPASWTGVIGFPSFHAEEILTSLWYLRKHWWIFLAALAFGALALVAVPIIGGHHVVDLLGGALVTAAAVFATNLPYSRTLGRRSLHLFPDLDLPPITPNK
jgi:hypothetical protein